MLFATITNANFSSPDFERWIAEALFRRDVVRTKYTARGGKIDFTPPDAATWSAADADAIRAAAAQGKGALTEIADEDIRSLKALVLYGSRVWPHTSNTPTRIGLSRTCLRVHVGHLAKLADDGMGKDALIQLVLDTGAAGVDAMALLDRANSGTYGNPRITKVRTGVRDRPGILISGHDLRDLHDLLEQTAGTGIDVYTHGEMLRALLSLVRKYTISTQLRQRVVEVRIRD
jgi:hydroxylamine reductase